MVHYRTDLWDYKPCNLVQFMAWFLVLRRLCHLVWNISWHHCRDRGVCETLYEENWDLHTQAHSRTRGSIGTTARCTAWRATYPNMRVQKFGRLVGLSNGRSETHTCGKPTAKHFSLCRQGHLRCLPCCLKHLMEGTEIYAMSAMKMQNEWFVRSTMQNWCLQMCILEQTRDIMSHATLYS